MEQPLSVQGESEKVVEDKKTGSSLSTHSKEQDSSNEKGPYVEDTQLPNFVDEEHGEGIPLHLDTAEEIVTTVIHLDDDPSLNPWTFRMFFIGMHYSVFKQSFTSANRVGMGLSCFGAVLEEIYYFKPQIIYVSISKFLLISHAMMN